MEERPAARLVSSGTAMETASIITFVSCILEVIESHNAAGGHEGATAAENCSLEGIAP